VNQENERLRTKNTCAANKEIYQRIGKKEEEKKREGKKRRRKNPEGKIRKGNRLQ